MHKLSLLAVALVSIGAVSMAYAGQKLYYNVTIDSVGKAAWGDLGTVRNSPDTVQRIGCWIYNYVGYSTVSCYATTAANVTASCSSTDPNIVDAARAIDGDSSLKFYWDGSNACTQILLSKSSAYGPKQP